MKTLNQVCAAASLCLSLSVLPDTASAAAVGGVTREEAYRVSERGPHHRVWSRAVTYTDASGQMLTETNSYTELATGLHFLHDGQWVESRPQFELLHGAAVAQQGQHQVTLAPNPATAGAVELTMPDGQRLRSHVLGLAFHDSSTGKRVLIAETKDTAGRLHAPNVVLFTNAFGDLKADIRYTVTRAGLEQDIILREQPPTPEDYGLNAATTRLQVWTEFLDPPAPRQTTRTLRLARGEEMADETLDFGPMRITRGRAFPLGEDTGQPDIPVGKRWLRVDGRSCLIEEVPLPEVREALEKLPPHGHASVRPAGDGVRHMASTRPLLPASRPEPDSIKGPGGVIELAQTMPTGPGFVLDYTSLNGTQGDITLAGNVTYLVTGPFYLTGAATLEAGAVIKYAANVGAKITLPVLDCRAAPGKPAVFTAADDNTVGETIAGSSGVPSGYYAYPALDFYNDYLPTTNSVWNLSHFRIAWAAQAIEASSWAFQLSLEHGQIVHCAAGVALPGQGSTRLRNVLFADVNNALNGLAYANITAQHVTFAGPVNYPYGGGILASVYSQYPTVTLNLKNCVLTRWNVFVAGGVVALSGEYNGFYQTPTPFGTGPVSPNSDPFLAQGAGHYYLADLSGTDFRDEGRATVDADLAEALRERTTTAPDLFQAVAWTQAQSFGRRAIRDNDAAPDLGYHYEALDYLFQDCWAAASVQLRDGVAIGARGSLGGWGLRLTDGGRLESVGLPTAMNRIVSFQHVQEDPPPVTGTGASSRPGNLWLLLAGGSDASRRMAFRFTEFAVGQGLENPMILVAATTLAELTLRDCRVRGGLVNVQFGRMTGPCQITWVNNVWERACGRVLYIASANPPPDHQHAVTVDCRNNLWRTGWAMFYYFANNGTLGLWEVRDNLFDQALASATTDTAGAALLLRTHNGFTTGTTSTLLGGTGTGNQTGLERDFASGPLGDYYYPVNDLAHSLARLRDAGSRTAPLAGLACHTTRTDHVADSDLVDIGFHYFVGDEPVADCDDVMTGVETAITITLSGQDDCLSGLWGDHLVFEVTSPPGHGSLGPITQLDATHATVDYTPEPGFNDQDSFLFRVRSSGLQSPTAQVTVTVVPAPTLAVECGPQSIVLKWTLPGWLQQLAASEFIKDFSIYRCSTPAGTTCTPPTSPPYAVVTDQLTLGNPDLWIFADTEVAADTVYCYRIVFRHQSGCDASQIYTSPESSTLCAAECCPDSQGPFWTRYGSTPQHLAEYIMEGTGITVVPGSASYVGAFVARGVFGNGTNASLPIDTGVILSTGDIRLAEGVNSSSSAGRDNSPVGGDTALNGLVPDLQTSDAAVLVFDITTPEPSRLVFEYCFASEEYPEYSGSWYNDIMGIFVDGVNIAYLPIPEHPPVGVDFVNGGCTGQVEAPAVNPLYYRDNCDPYPLFHSQPPYSKCPSLYAIQYDGMTMLLEAQASLSANTVYRIKLAVADATDRAYDSALLIKASIPCP